MKAYELGPQDGLSSLRLAERATPTPGPDEVLVRVKAACLNHRDLLALKAQYGPKKAEDRVPLSDGVGEIAALGEGVTGWNEGARVIAPHFVGWIDGPFSPAVFGQDLGITRDGWLAEYIVLPAAALIAVPDSVPDESAAALAAAGTTVWHAVKRFGKAGPDSRVLALGTGGVSMLALQVAKALGAEVAITSSSEAKLARCRDLGADYTVNYRDEPDWAAALVEPMGGQGADVVVDTAGLVSIEQTLAACAPNARVALIGGLAGQLERAPNMFAILGKNLMLKGITSGSRAMLAQLADFVAEHGIEPLIDRRFAFDDAPAAFAHLASGDHMGKVLIEV